MKEDTEFLPERVNDLCGSRDEQTASATAPLTFKGTPGPWDIEAGFLVTRRYAGGMGIPMFQLNGFCECGDRINPVTGTDEQAAADMNLIAAAPDLLEALTKLLDGHTISGTYRMEQDSIDAARAALAKATGAPQ